MMDVIERSWKFRRLAIFGQLIAVNVIVAYIVIWGNDSRLHQDIAQALILLGGAVLNAYVFGAAWDDKNKGREAVDMKKSDRAP